VKENDPGVAAQLEEESRDVRAGDRDDRLVATKG
jgi:hypothetical protein